MSLRWSAMQICPRLQSTLSTQPINPTSQSTLSIQPLINKVIVPKNPTFPARIYSAVTNVCGYQVTYSYYIATLTNRNPSHETNKKLMNTLQRQYEHHQQVSMYVDTVHPEGINDIGVYLNLAGNASTPFPCRVEYSLRLVHYDGKPTSRYTIAGTPGGAEFARGTYWGRRSFISKDRITVANSPYVQIAQLPAEAPPLPVPVIAVGAGFIDLTDDDVPPPPLVPVAVVTFVVTFRFLPSV